MRTEPKIGFFYRRPLCLSLTVGLFAFVFALILPPPWKTGAALLSLSTSVFLLLLSVIKRKTTLKAIRTLRRLSLTFFLCALPFLVTFLAIDRIYLEVPKDEELTLECVVTDIVTDLEGGSVCRVKVVKLDRVDVSFEAQLSFFDGDERFVGDRLVCSATLSPARESEYGSFLLADGCHFLSKDAEVLSLLESGNGPHTPEENPVAVMLHDMYLKETDKDTAAMLSALLIGDTSDFSPATSLAFKRLGLAHISSVSGMHVSLLICFMELILRRLRTPKLARIVISSAALFFYLWLVGFAIAAVRAGLMQYVFILAFIRRGQYDSMTALVAAAYLLCLLTPGCIYSASFWLSVVATAGLLAVMEGRARENELSLMSAIRLELTSKSLLPFSHRISRSCLLIVKRVWSFVSLNLLIGIGATVATLPISVFLFGAFSPLSLVATLFCTPLVTLLLYGACLFPVARFIPLFPSMLESVTAFMNRGIQLLAEPDFAYLYADYPPVILLLSLLVVFFFILLVLPFKLRRLTGVVTAFFLVVTTAFLIHTYKRTAEEPLFLYQPSPSSSAITLRHAGALSYIETRERASSDPADCLALLKAAERVSIDDYVLTAYDRKVIGRLSNIASDIKIDTIYLPTPKTLTEEEYARKILILCASLRIDTVFYDEGIPCSISEDGSFTVSKAPDLRDNQSTVLQIRTERHQIFYTSLARMEGIAPPEYLYGPLTKADVVIFKNVTSKRLENVRFLDFKKGAYVILNGSYVDDGCANRIKAAGENITVFKENKSLIAFPLNE